MYCSAEFWTGILLGKRVSMCENDRVYECVCIYSPNSIRRDGNPRKDASDCYYIIKIFIKGNNIYVTTNGGEARIHK